MKMTEQLETIDIQEIAKFLSKSVDAIEYRDTYLTKEFTEWLLSFDEGEERDGDDVFDYPEGRYYLTARDDLGWEIAENFFFLEKVNEDNFEMLRDLYETSLEDDVLHEIIPTALELTRKMNGCSNI